MTQPPDMYHPGASVPGTRPPLRLTIYPIHTPHRVTLTASIHRHLTDAEAAAEYLASTLAAEWGNARHPDPRGDEYDDVDENEVWNRFATHDHAGDNDYE